MTRTPFAYGHKLPGGDMQLATTEQTRHAEMDRKIDADMQIARDRDRRVRYALRNTETECRRIAAGFLEIALRVRGVREWEDLSDLLNDLRTHDALAEHGLCDLIEDNVLAEAVKEMHR